MEQEIDDRLGTMHTSANSGEFQYRDSGFSEEEYYTLLFTPLQATPWNSICSLAHMGYKAVCELNLGRLVKKWQQFGKILMLQMFGMLGYNIYSQE